MAVDVNLDPHYRNGPVDDEQWTGRRGFTSSGDTPGFIDYGLTTDNPKKVWLWLKP